MSAWQRRLQLSLLACGLVALGAVSLAPGVLSIVGAQTGISPLAILVAKVSSCGLIESTNPPEVDNP